MGGKAPKPTDPKETAAASTGTNIGTAITNAWLTNPNQIGPGGSQTLSQSGTTQYTDPYTGQTYDIPQFTSEITLDPTQQAIFDARGEAGLNQAQLASDLSAQVRDQLSGGFSLGNEEVESRLFDLGSRRLEPLFAQRDEDLRSRLASQGLKVGTAAYDRELSRLEQQENDAYNQLLLTGRGQAVSEQLAEDNQRLGQLSALLSGGQVETPNFRANSISGAPTTDVASIIANNDQQRMNAWQQNQAAIGSTLSGLGGLFSLSDERAKTDKEKIGETEDGMGIYSFKYKGSPKTEIGLMAQEVSRKRPGAVRKGRNGLMHVNYEEALK